MKADYDSISEDWAKSRNELPPKDRSLFEFFLGKLPGQADVLDLGCGTGIPIARLLDSRGFRVTGIDRSKRLLQKAKTNVPRACFHKEEIEDFRASKRYDGVVLWDVLFHLPREEHGPLIEEIHDSLCPEGLFIVSSGGCGEELPPFTDSMFGVEFFYDSYPIEEFLSVCSDAGFVVKKYDLVNKPDGGRDKGRIGVVLQKT